MAKVKKIFYLSTFVELITSIDVESSG